MTNVLIYSLVIYSPIMGVDLMINSHCLYFIFPLSGLGEIFPEMHVVVNWFSENTVK